MSMVMVFIGIGMAIDLFSCVLFLRRNRRGHGPSGIFAATAILFYFFPLILSGTPVLTSSVWLDCLCLAGFHILVVLGIPCADRKRLRFRSADSTREGK
jgi:hypothetical protein